jgi:putative DNA methylase
MPLVDLGNSIFAEVNSLSAQLGSFENSLDYTAKGISISGVHRGTATQADAMAQEISRDRIVSTNPPYYDNIGYAVLSDYFYVWLRRSLKPVFPDLFATVASTKS